MAIQPIPRTGTPTEFFIVDLLTQNRDLSKLVMALVRDKAKLEKDKAKLQSLVTPLNEEIAALKAELDHFQKTCYVYWEQIDQQKREIETLETRIRLCDRVYKEFENAIRRKNKTISQLQAQQNGVHSQAASQAAPHDPNSQ